MRQRPREHDAAATGEHVLPAIKLIGDGRGLHGRAGSRMPQSLAIGSVERENIAARVTGKGEPAIGGHHAGARAALANVVAPANFAGLVVDGFDYALAPHAIVGARPAIGAVGGLGKVDAPAGMRIDDEEAGFGIEAGRAIVRHAALIGSDQSCRRAWAPFRDWEWGGPACPMPSRPVDGAEGSGQQALAVSAIEDEEVAVARTLH